MIHLTPSLPKVAYLLLQPKSGGGGEDFAGGTRFKVATWEAGWERRPRGDAGRREEERPHPRELMQGPPLCLILPALFVFFLLFIAFKLICVYLLISKTEVKFEQHKTDILERRI